MTSMRSEFVGLVESLAGRFTVAFLVPALFRLRPDLASPERAAPSSGDGGGGEFRRDEIESLRDIIRWWRRRGDETGNSVLPRFKGVRRKTSVRINEQLYTATLERVRETGDTARMGDNISQVLEFLLWAYLGYDGSFLAEQPHAKAGDGQAAPSGGPGSYAVTSEDH